VRAKMETKNLAKVNRSFSLELKSRSSLKTAIVGNGQGDRVTIEGRIGALKRIEFVEGTILEIVGTGGVLRVDLSRDELMPQSSTPRRVS